MKSRSMWDMWMVVRKALQSQRLLRRGWIVPASVAACIQVVFFAYRLWQTLQLGHPPLDVDAALFQHAGWYVTQGAVPYIDIWDPKPPLVIETTALLALLSQGNMFLLHLLCVLLTSAAAVGVVALIGVLAHRLTDDSLASITAGLVILTMLGFSRLPSLGFRPKYFMMFFGLLAIYLQQSDHPFLSGIAAAMSVAYLLFGSIFFLISFGMVFKSREQVVSFLTGAFIATLVILIPIVVRGATIPMLVEVVLAPLFVPEKQSMIVRFIKLFKFLGLTFPLVVLGGYGLFQAVTRELKPVWWGLMGGLLALVQIFFLDFDDFPDLFLGLAFASIGYGVFISSLRRNRRAFALLVVVILLVNPVVLKGLWMMQSRIDLVKNQEQVSIDPRHGLPSVQQIYWEQMKPETCHYRLSGMEVGWLEETNRSYEASVCGQFWWPGIGNGE